MSPTSGPTLTTFSEWGSGFVPGGTTTLHFLKPDGSEYPTRIQDIDANGSFWLTYTAPPTKAPGIYKWWAVDNSTGIKSNELIFEITGTSGPMIWQTPSGGPAGTTFKEYGVGFTPNHDLTLHFLKLDGTEYPTKTMRTNSVGYFELTYESSPDKEPGTYTWWAVDEQNGQSSSNSFRIIERGTSILYISGHTIWGNETWYGGNTYVVDGPVIVGDESSLTIEPGVVIKFANGAGITVNGTLNASGTESEKIVFISVWDDAYGGSTDLTYYGPDYPTEPGIYELTSGGYPGWAYNYWGSITFGPSSANSVINHAILRYGGSPGGYPIPMLGIQSSSLTVSNGSISYGLGDGIKITNASRVITGNSITENRGYGIELNNSNAAITGNTVSDNNNWGIYASDNSGPTIIGNAVNNNTGYAIYFAGNSDPQEVTGNTMSGNTLVDGV